MKGKKLLKMKNLIDCFPEAQHVFVPYRYSSVYCAKCHNVKKVAFWTRVMGCVKVMRDECAFPSEDLSSLEENGIMDRLIYNSSSSIFNE